MLHFLAENKAVKCHKRQTSLIQKSENRIDAFFFIKTRANITDLGFFLENKNFSNILNKI